MAVDKSRLFTSQSIAFSIPKIGKWIKGYSQFLTKYTRDALPNITNSEGVTVAHFHNEVGRGGYFPAYAGTSEGQFLALRGYLDMYGTTHEREWLDKALHLASSLDWVYYSGMSLPEPNVTNQLWVPYWLVNAKQSQATSEEFVLDDVIHFNGGVGYTSKDVNRVFSARSLDSRLSWDSPTADIIGTKYDVYYFEPVSSGTLIRLRSNFTGDLYVALSTLTGPIIHKNEVFDAYPIWRKYKDGEKGAAVDSLFWSYDCYELLYRFTGNTKWYKAREATKNMIYMSHQITVNNDYLTLDTSSTDALNSAGTYIYDMRANKTRSYRKPSGHIVLEVKADSNYKSVEIGKGNIQEKWDSANKYIDVRLASDIPLTAKAVIIPNIEHYDQYWEARLQLIGGNNLQTISLRYADFYNASQVRWSAYYRPDSQSGFIVKSSHSTVSYMDVSTSLGATARRFQFFRGEEKGTIIDYSETDEDGTPIPKEIVYTYTGWAQYFLTFAEGMPSTILPMQYRGNGMGMVVTDANGVGWVANLPDRSSFGTVALSWSDFVLADYQEVDISGVTGPAGGRVRNYALNGLNIQAWCEIVYIGVLQKMPLQTNISTFCINDNEPAAHKLTIEYVRPYPLPVLNYTPWVAPFGFGTENNQIMNWRGMPYSGYQAPYIWEKLNESTGVNVVLGFLSDAADAYYAATGVRGGFAPVYLWDRWDSKDYGAKNTFTWDGPDPNTTWAGFQYRTADTVARTWYLDPDNQVAATLTLDFLHMINRYWTSSQNKILTDFPSNGAPYGNYDETHMAGLLLRTALYAHLAGGDDSVIITIITRSLRYLDRFYVDPNTPTSQVGGTWSVDPSNDIWYTYWGGEILSALSLLLNHTLEFLNVKGASRVHRLPIYHPSILESGSSSMRITTPTRVGAFELLATSDAKASPIRVYTRSGVKAIRDS
ncbi:hypothetical protein SAMN04487969_10651 [Paenibacillus algorifonticola]|uniref:Uncharacterized protein n=1 Tax=Paenibacillus algorifonticola TaxID=684063 RepID=A0A1I2D1U5_9BACL|nr:hypothetical protein [Paenibacillus algorifonticola]SFE74492.1 hypothetical protein SAMN04487969_10651 [Paenibacillus algorifonticola]